MLACHDQNIVLEGEGSSVAFKPSAGDLGHVVWISEVALQLF